MKLGLQAASRFDNRARVVPSSWPMVAGLAFFAMTAVMVQTGCRHGPEAASNPLKAGTAEVDITPLAGHRMAGYFDERLATGMQDPLHAKAIVLQQGTEKIAMVFCDLVGLSLNVTTNARARASQLIGIPVSHILVSATHSHTGPLFDDVRRDFFHQEAVAKFGKDPQEEVYYPEFLTERIVKAVCDANSKLAPANVSAGFAIQEGLSFNRRYHMKDGSVRFNPGQLNTNIVRPAGPIDPEVGLLFVRDNGGRPVANVTVFACHCDSTGGTLFSADYPYYLERTLQGQLGKQMVCAFAAGCCGDINHINVAVKETIKGPEVADRIGTTLGKTVLGQLPGLRPVVQPRVAVRSKRFLAALQRVAPEEAAAARAKFATLFTGDAPFMEQVQAVKAVDLAARGTEWPVEVQVLRIDAETALVGLPGEIFTELGLAIKKGSPFKTTIVMSICNDRPGYIPTRKAFGEGSYEVTNSRLQPGSGERLVEAAVELLQQLKL